MLLAIITANFQSLFNCSHSRLLHVKDTKTLLLTIHFDNNLLTKDARTVNSFATSNSQSRRKNYFTRKMSRVKKKEMTKVKQN